MGHEDARREHRIGGPKMRHPSKRFRLRDNRDGNARLHLPPGSGKATFKNQSDGLPHEARIPVPKAVRVQADVGLPYYDFRCALMPQV
jgi:hypothetical protein